jgi:hypothetical protein
VPQTRQDVFGGAHLAFTPGRGVEPVAGPHQEAVAKRTGPCSEAPVPHPAGMQPAQPEIPA